MDTSSTKLLGEALKVLDEYYRAVVMKAAEEIVECQDEFFESYAGRAEEIIDRYGMHLQSVARVYLDLSTVNEMLIRQQAVASGVGPRGPVEPTGRLVGPDTLLVPGDQILVEWRGFWWQASIVDLQPDGNVRIHYDGWGDNWDEVVPRSRLQEAVADAPQ